MSCYVYDFIKFAIIAGGINGVSQACTQPNDGQKYYWPKHVVAMLCITDNIVVL